MPSILTPKAVGRPVKGKRPLVFWKQIVPRTPIHYTDPADGQQRTLQFDDPNYHADLLGAFRGRLGPDSVAFQLADSQNRHGRDLDPERQRGVVVEMADLTELPARVRARVQAEAAERGTAPEGTYAKIRMFNEKAAQAVLDNRDLAVSARIREGFTRADGTYVPRAVIHVCGTYDSQVVGMSPWTEADLTGYPDGDSTTLDLSNTTYLEAAKVPKNKTKTRTAGAPPLTDQEIEDTIEQLTDEQFAEFLERLDVQALEPGDPDGDGDDDSDGDDSDDDAEPVEAGQLVGADANLSVQAYQAAQAASQRADEALSQLAQGQWLAERNQLINQGVPPAAIDLCAPYLSAPGGFVVDLSNSDGTTAETDVAKDLRALLGMLAGYVDLSNELGHGGQFQEGTDADPDGPQLAEWEKQFPG